MLASAGTMKMRIVPAALLLAALAGFGTACGDGQSSALKPTTFAVSPGPWAVVAGARTSTNSVSAVTSDKPASAQNLISRRESCTMAAEHPVVFATGT